MTEDEVNQFEEDFIYLEGFDQEMREENGEGDEYESSYKPESLRILLEIGLDIDQEHALDNTTALQRACRDGHFELAKELIDQGANVNKAGRLGQTPLHYAALAGELECLKLLLDKGADVQSKDYKGETPEDKAMRWNKLDCLKLLTQERANTLKRKCLSEAGDDWSPKRVKHI